MRTESMQAQNGAVASEIPSGIDAESPAVQQIMRDVRKLGRQPQEIKNPVSEAEQEEYRLAKRVRNHGSERIPQLAHSARYHYLQL